MARVELSPVIAQARKQWTRCAEAEDAQRKAILLAKEFRALKQWPDAIRLAREGAGSLAGQPPQPPRPCLVVDRLSQPVRQVSNTIKNADFGFDVMPNGGGADIETAEILKGYMRRVQNQARGESPIEWAADGAIEGGIGWFRLRQRYVHDVWDGDQGDPEAYDQELCLERLPNNLAVYCDPGANKPTRRDAMVMFVVEDLSWDTYHAKYPNAAKRGIEEFQSTGDMAAWADKDKVRVAEYWRIDYETRAITSGEQTRTIRKPIVRCSLINAVEELDTFVWPGLRIPIFPVLGEELNVDGKPLLRGIIAMGMDAQRMVNYTYSGAVEIFALGPKSPYIVAAASVARYKPIWDTSNTYNYSYLPFDEWDDQGRQYARPQRDQSEPPIQAAVALMQTSEEAIKASTSTGDASLGNTNPNERSGRALEALQSQSELANSNYADNVKRALIDCADEMVYVIPKITRPGQIVHIMGLDDEPEQVMVGQAFMKGPDGVPQAAPHITPEMAKLQGSLHKFYDLTSGRYATTVTVGKASATRQQEGSRALGDLIPHLPPEMAAVVMPDYVKQLSFPGAQGIAERLESVLPPHLQPQKDGQPSALPPEAQQQIQQLQQQNQELQQAVQTDQVKQQGEIERERMRGEIELEKARMDNATRIEVARIGAAKTILDTRAAAEEEQLATGLQIAADAAAQAREHAHAAGMAVLGHAASAGSQAADHAQQADTLAATQAHASAESEAAREAAREQAAQAEQQGA